MLDFDKVVGVRGSMRGRLRSSLLACSFEAGGNRSCRGRSIAERIYCLLRSVG